MPHRKIIKLCNAIASEKEPKKLIPLVKGLRALMTQLQTSIDSGDGSVSVVESVHQLNVIACIDAVLQKLQIHLQDKSGKRATPDSPKWIT